MKRLLILRHAKSDWGTGVPDFDRPLNARGRAAATAMGAVVRDLSPDLAICSPARRTRETLERLALTCPVRFEDRMYDASADDLRAVLAETGEAVTVLLVGHMPGVAGLAAEMSEGDRSEERARMVEHYPTAALTVINVDQKRVTRFVTPRGSD